MGLVARTTKLKAPELFIRIQTMITSSARYCEGNSSVALTLALLEFCPAGGHGL